MKGCDKPPAAQVIGNQPATRNCHAMAGNHRFQSERRGKVRPASYVVLHELPADAWGYAGETQEFRYVKRRVL